MTFDYSSIRQKLKDKPKVGQISVRINPEALQKLQEYADSMYTTRAALIRAIVEQGIDHLTQTMPRP